MSTWRKAFSALDCETRGVETILPWTALGASCECRRQNTAAEAMTWQHEKKMEESSLMSRIVNVVHMRRANFEVRRFDRSSSALAQCGCQFFRVVQELVVFMFDSFATDRKPSTAALTNHDIHTMSQESRFNTQDRQGPHTVNQKSFNVRVAIRLRLFVIRSATIEDTRTCSQFY